MTVGLDEAIAWVTGSMKAVTGLQRGGAAPALAGGGVQAGPSR